MAGVETERTQVRPEIDQKSIEALIAKDYAGLRLLLIRRTRNEALAADILNDAICTTLEKWRAGQIERPELICGFIFQVALNLLRNHHRNLGERADRRAQVEKLEVLEDGSDSADAAIQSNLALRVKGFLQGLNNVRDRLILKRFYLDEEDKSSICRDLQLSAEQFDKVLHRAKARLKDLLQSSGLGKSDFFCWAFA